MMGKKVRRWEIIIVAGLIGIVMLVGYAYGYVYSGHK
jgi:zinc transporter ZupT